MKKRSPKKKKKDRRPQRNRRCRFCQDNIESIDYKDLALVKRYITERGKIRARRTTGTCAKHQRQIARAVKRARVIGQAPFKLEYHRK
ncbi:MAG: 30S ribosomal protein S18 [Candidatus Coatesbacteria bacterium]|jgi:small subunit ribosomal protein S18|nr:30S ribosomal protein S18 [Candidatus Coatesbacteria bacterium]